MIRSRAFLRAYGLLPHRLINRSAGRVSRVTKPRALVHAAIDAWTAREDIDLEPFDREDWTSLEHFFLRRLRPGARPIGEELTSAVDGRVVGLGPIEKDTILQVKGRALSLSQVLRAPAERFEGGTYVTTFLRPKGYHYVHAPARGTVTGIRWIPGRYFPQNEDALQHIDGIYERNERAVLDFESVDGWRCALVMVAASVVGGIHVKGVNDVRRANGFRRDVEKGDELGHFTFGSTVIAILPSARIDVEIGEDVRMGQTIGRIA
jgi:phosphatidylserine decarboxylase